MRDGTDSTMEQDPKATQGEFKTLVNMTVPQLRKWLASEASRSVGMTSKGARVTGAESGESVGHHMGEHILDLLGKKASDLDDDDLAAMRKVIGYIRRHSAQRPEGDVTQTRWRKSLMNWGHDPLRD
jgi:hypothetical protein